MRRNLDTFHNVNYPGAMNITVEPKHKVGSSSIRLQNPSLKSIPGVMPSFERGPHVIIAFSDRLTSHMRWYLLMIVLFWEKCARLHVNP